MSDARRPPDVLLRGEHSGGRVSVVETAPAPGAGPPLHRHEFDEAFYVIEGELVFQLGDERRTVRAGELAFAPGGVPHTFANLSDAPARQLIICTPAGFERMFARLAAERRGIEPPEWAMQPIPEVTKLGPPLTERPAG
jgi:quercetin dioxygenase-like cupin family protein